MIVVKTEIYTVTSTLVRGEFTVSNNLSGKQVATIIADYLPGSRRSFAYDKHNKKNYAESIFMEFAIEHVLKKL